MSMKRSLLKLGITAMVVSVMALLQFYHHDKNPHHDNLSPQPLDSVKLVRPDSKTQKRVSEIYDKLPLSFEANNGQVDKQVKFVSKGKNYNLFLTKNGALLFLKKNGSKSRHKIDLTKDKTTLKNNREQPETALVQMQLIGSNSDAHIIGQNELPSKSNYFVGKDPKQWHTDVSSFSKVTYQDMYQGIDMVYYGNHQELEYDFVVNSGADPANIKLHFEGASKITLNEQGDLVLDVDGGKVFKHKPIIYQQIDGIKQMVAGNYLLNNNDISFQIGDYDTSKPLLIDPVINYSTYVGGSGLDVGEGVAVDQSGNAYITGYTASTNFPTASPLQSSFGGGGDDIFVTKINSSGSSLVYSTYLGGNGYDQGYGITVDSSGNAYVTGNTSSTNFPTTSGALQTSYAGGPDDAFVIKINSSGSALVYSTYLGGSGDEGGRAVVVDSSGNAYITGITTSSNFSTVSAFQATYAGAGDAFVTKINSSGTALSYSSYLGGSGSEIEGFISIAIDSSNNAYVVGQTKSSNFPTLNALQSSFGGGSIYGDAFIVKVGTTGNKVYSTYLGGNGDDAGQGVVVDSSNDVYITGFTTSTNFPTVNPLQSAFSGGSNFGDAFIAKISNAGSLTYSTYLGGSGEDQALSVVIDLSKNIYIVGSTSSSNFPTKNATQNVFGGATDAFVAKISPTGNTLFYSTYLGGSDIDTGKSIAIDLVGDIYVLGSTVSSDFPTMNSIQSFAGVRDVYVTKIIVCPKCLTTTLPTTQLDIGTVGTAYNQNLYSFALTSGSLPTGLTVGNTGVISGNPTTSGTYTFTITSTDANGCSDSRTYSITMH